MSPVFIHSDLIRSRTLYGNRIQTNDIAGFARAAHHWLAEEFGPDLIFPAFNYDFGRTRLLDVNQDPVQVGVLPEYLRTQPEFHRTPVPFFSAIAPFPIPLDTGEACRPLGQGSVFQWLTEQNGDIVFMGCPIDAMTYIHYAESSLPQGPAYRYDKTFPGRIKIGDETRPVTCTMHVRPMGVPMDYDFGIIERDLREAKILKNLDKKGQVVRAACRDLLDFFLARYQEDPLYGLTQEARNALAPLTANGASRVRIQDFEPAKGEDA